MDALLVLFLIVGLALKGGGVDNNVANSQALPFPCNGGMNSFGFCNMRLSIEKRVMDLVGRLTLDEKVSQLGTGAGAIPRLGIPAYQWGSEALHGVGPGTRFKPPVPSATSFPTVILSAASFNVSLWEAIGQAVSTEARAMYNVGLAGLTYWSPNVNIFRDPRWGRGHETPGEDPFLTSAYASSYVKGLQQADPSDPNRLKVAACCKHYTAYDLDNWNGIQRFTFDALVSQQDLADTYNPPFKSCVLDGNVASVMCSYNKINGVPSCADSNLLKGTVRGQWNLKGYIVSDCDSVDVLYNTQHYTATPEDAVCDVLKAGLDLDCGGFLGQHTKSAVMAGKVNESYIDQALMNNFRTLMRLGWFDGNPAKQQFGNLGPSDVCTDEHRELATEAARQGIVLLKNDKGTLPFAADKISSLAVVGPNADATETMIGNYAGVPCRYTSPLEGLTEYVPPLYAPGCANVLCAKSDLVDEAVQQARRADATVLVIGGNLSLEAEGLDRQSLLLPGYQEELVSQVAKASKGPVVLVIMSGGPFDITFAKHDENIKGILWVGYPGEAGGTAIADILFGKHNPSGKLPVTWYPQEFVDKVPMTNMNMRPDPSTGYPGRTHRFYTGETVYDFGEGLSYIQFNTTLDKGPKLVIVPIMNDTKHPCTASSCDTIPVRHTTCDDLSMDIHVDVQNTGSKDGSHVVFLFSTPPSKHQSDGAPKRQLVGFKKVHVNAGGKERVLFNVDVCKYLSIVDKTGNSHIPLGSHLLHIGDLQHFVSLQVGT
ncbi:hypothetical protein SUGI_0101480 [Cryptomeria japonica]|uniref:beta-xylosidase/alpha-L-arabinofuranosidase 1-like n=1 Tax=Cryptomeria japonica TaxID=3369 RepID=UPI002408D87C|nr:beta-xylosidase/alpha-L-arabinofuranosidase 1-like [Cryptomeria japonica]GLJ09080.1 hypothetical protein SUGI_0101480 [Cryptomeria japonica]